MKTDGIITVVVPVRNRADIVLRTLDSIAAQTYAPLHLIVVDNDSEDSTLDKISSWAKEHNTDNLDVKILQCKEHGAPQARNHGLAEAKTPWIMFFDSDDEMHPEHIANIVHEIKCNPDCELIYFDAAKMDDDGWTQAMSVYDENIMRGHLFHCSLSTQRMAINTNLMARSGNWNKECAIWNDMEMGVRLLLNAKNVRKLHGDPKVIVHPQHANSITGTSYRDRAGLFENTLDIIDKDIKESHLDNNTQNLYSLWIECRRMIVAAMYAREGDKKRAGELLGQVLKRNNRLARLKLRAVYTAQRIMGRGGSATATLLFKPVKAKAK